MPLAETVPNPIATTISIKNLLFATDFSEASAAAFPYAVAICHHYGATLHATHVVTENAFVMSSGWADPSLIGAAYESTRNLAQAKMHELATCMAGVPHRTWVCTGEFWDALAEVVAVNRIDFLVSGTHGRTGMSKLLMGSTAEEILRRAHCPVLTVGPRVHGQSGTRGRTANGDFAPAEINLQRIVYATNLKPHSLAARYFAFSLAREFQAQLTLLHVNEDQASLTRNRELLSANRRLQEMLYGEENLQTRPECVVEHGPAADRILETASQQHADLIVLGVRTPGSLPFLATISWASAPKVVAGAHCPVLTVRG